MVRRVRSVLARDDMAAEEPEVYHGLMVLRRHIEGMKFAMGVGRAAWEEWRKGRSGMSHLGLVVRT